MYLPNMALFCSLIVPIQQSPNLPLSPPLMSKRFQNTSKFRNVVGRVAKSEVIIVSFCEILESFFLTGLNLVGMVL